MPAGDTYLGRRVDAARAAIDDAYERFVRPLVPAGVALWDVHAHLGEDADGVSLQPEALLAGMNAYGVARAFVFPFKAASARDYTRLNDQVIEQCAGSDGALIPFCRSEPSKRFGVELERALERGARGIKLHPTGDGFDFSHVDLRIPFAIAAERSVPLLVHAGRGLPPLAAQLAELLEAFPSAPTILAHAAIADMTGVVTSCAAAPNLYFDTSVWNALDVHALVAQVPPERILYGTDAPYYVAPCAQAKLLLALRTANATDSDVANVIWKNAARLAAGQEAETPSAPRGTGAPSVPFERLRAHEYLLMAVPLVWLRQPDAVGFLRLAVQALRPESEELATAIDLLELAEVCWIEELESGGREELLALSWLTFRLIELADALVLGG